MAARGHEFKKPVCDHDKFRYVMVAAAGDLDRTRRVARAREVVDPVTVAPRRLAAHANVAPYFSMHCIIDKKILNC